MPERVPADIFPESGFDPRFPYVLLLNLLLWYGRRVTGLANNHPSGAENALSLCCINAWTSAGSSGTRSREYSVFTSPTRP